MKTQLLNEIESTYTKKDWWVDLAITSAMVFIILGTLLAIVDAVTGYELHEVIGEVISK